MEYKEIIAEWLRSADYSAAKNGRVLLSALLRDFICFCVRNGYDVPPVTDRSLSCALQEMCYEKVQTFEGMAFIMSKK